jgi:hypothetical protein
MKHFHELEKLERSLMEPGVRSSPEALAALLAEEFIEFGASGTIYDKRQAIDAAAHSDDHAISLHDFTAQALAPNVALVTYRATTRSAAGQERYSLRSSIWKMTDAGWKLVFHQGTPTAAVQ